jgi:outer membrane protein assembly factor BamA
MGDPLDQRMVERDVHVLANLRWFDSVRAEAVPITDSKLNSDRSRGPMLPELVN